MRLFHKVYAWFYGYFWLSCPSCGRKFGGHEVVEGNRVKPVGSGYFCVCPKCHAAGIGIDPKYMKTR